MHSTKKPITYWFKAMWWFTTRKSGVNAVNLKDLLGLGSYDTAWTWLQKLRHCTSLKNCLALLNDFVLGGQKFAEGKTIVLAAVEKIGTYPKVALDFSSIH